MNHTPQRTHLHLLALCVLIAPAAFARNFGPQTSEEKTGQAETGQAAPQNNSGGAASASSASSATARLLLKLSYPRDTLASRAAQLHHHAQCQAGDPLYLETTFPIVVNDRIVIPAGSFVQGEITEAKRAAKGKGGAEVRIRLTTLVLPNGYTAKFDAVPTNAGTGGSEYSDKNKEGQITNDRDKAADAGTVIKTTGAGAGIGAIAGRRRRSGHRRGCGRHVGPGHGVFDARSGSRTSARQQRGRHAGPAPLPGRGKN